MESRHSICPGMFRTERRKQGKEQNGRRVERAKGDQELIEGAKEKEKDKNGKRKIGKGKTWQDNRKNRKDKHRQEKVGKSDRKEDAVELGL